MNKEEIEINKNEIAEIVINILDKGSNYIIKSMPINEHIKEILCNVKVALKEKDFKNMVKVAISSSITEGAQALGVRKEGISSIEEMIDASFEGGITKSINIGVDMIEQVKKYGNLFYNYIEDFFTRLRGFIDSKEFKNKVYSCVSKCLNKVDNFKEMCNDWYDAYDEFNISSLKEIASKLNKMKGQVGFDQNCISENSIIQNITEFVSKNNKKLTKTQFDIYSELEKV